MFDLPFFTLLFAAQIAAVCARRLPIGYDHPEELPAWASTRKGETILSMISIPFAFQEMVLLPYGLLVLPWYTVIVCVTIAVVATILFWNLFLSNVVYRHGLFVAILSTYPITLLVASWYFWYLREEHVISLNLGFYIGIAVLVCYRILNILYVKKRSSF